MNSFSPPVRSAPTRSFIVADPSKLTFFAQANTARFATHASAGAFSGLGADASTGTVPPADNTALNIAAMGGSFFRNLIGGTQPVPPYGAGAVPQPKAYAQDTSVLGLPAGLAIGLGVAVAGFVGYKLLKKK